METIFETVRTELKLAISKLEKYRLAEDFQNYKSLVDTLSPLINVIDLKCREDYKRYDILMLQFIKEVCGEIEKEAKELAVSKLKYLKKDDIRKYRDSSISLEKLLVIPYKLKSRIPYSVMEKLKFTF